MSVLVVLTLSSAVFRNFVLDTDSFIRHALSHKKGRTAIGKPRQNSLALVLVRFIHGAQPYFVNAAKAS